MVAGLFRLAEAAVTVNDSAAREARIGCNALREVLMKAYVVITAGLGKARDIAHTIRGLPGVKMADACWGTGDVYTVIEFPAWKELNALVLDKIHSMPGVTRTETHVAVEE
jgi:DNA-binding Lrp family transcriptional regulator